MENYYIGTMNGYFLKKFGFRLLSENISLRNSFIEGYKIKMKDGSDCIAFLENDKNSKITLDSIGKCYIAKVEENPSDAYENSNYRVYLLGQGCEFTEKTLDESCQKNITKGTLKYLIDLDEKKLNKMKTRQLSITDNIDDAKASEKLSQESNNQGSSKESNNELIAQYQELLNNIRHSHKNSKQLLSDKNRLISSTSSNIQTSTDKLEDLNNKINEANQEIAKNNSDFEKKNNIITTLRAMITIFFILLLIMIVYYGALYTRDVYPETYNSISNSINNSFSSFSSFNTNY
jgi:hypothetical protein